MSELAAVILAAGLGTRMKSEHPKVLHEVLGRPMLFYAIDVALEAGAEPLIVVTGYGREATESAVLAAYPESPIRFALQAQQIGTGHAVACAADHLRDGPARVLILNGDLTDLRVETVGRLVRETKDAEAPVGIVTAHFPDPSGYGRVVRDAEGRVTRIVEHKDASDAELGLTEINAGAYLFETGFLLDHVGSLDDDNAQCEVYLTDLVDRAVRAGRNVVAVVVDDPEETAGVNSRVDLARAEARARRDRNERLMRSGVTFIDPERTRVEAGVQVANDVILWPGVILRGRTRIGRGTEIEAGCVISDSDLGESVHVLPYCHMDGARIGPHARVGPFARLRPGAVLEAEVRIGNFVEVKKSVVGRGSKANHLSYLGDAEIGAGVNVGAGTITCNYDGRHKYRTVIEDGAFIGSDTQFVAPVTVGAGAFVAAGTTVTEAVPPGALAISRAPQTNVEGYAERKRAKWAAKDGEK